jgi:D-aminopeptidase
MPHPEKMAAVIQRHSLNWEVLDPLYESAVQAVDEAVINALVQGEDVPTVKPAGYVVPALDTEQLLKLMRQYGRM